MLQGLSKLFYLLAAIIPLLVIFVMGELNARILGSMVATILPLLFFGAVCTALDDIVYYLKSAHEGRK